MLISKFDLYKSEWLELVFENRNKGYGAYQLRQHNGRTMMLAMTFTFLGVGLIFGTSVILQHRNHITTRNIDHVIDLTNLKETPIKKIPPPVIPHTQLPPPVATHRFVPPVVTIDDKVTEQPPKLEDLTEAISTTTTKGAKGDQPVPIIDDAPPGNNDAATEDTKVHEVFEVQIMPTPIGGEDAWNKFLSKNLRYPSEAQDAGVGGRVYMSFIVEKDGSLSNVTVERGAGYGMDEEATRVLKLAKAWKPGLQNGRPVRVKFVIPINFQIGGEN